ncbi:winged helix DNA-binding domain-containing protein [Microlunatus speluncae]|uniref:winged helix DNA-binding domain-containing protein n=1 Tax=Microlunatus speluncae TaxID=2594267 RepID=UPI0012668407|nr:winged helix DNA-binding domain-containing protein [Microlunatus speluncae]
MTRTAVTVDRATLNRTTLERQRLLRRADATAVDTIQHLVGLQAQEPLEPYVGLWSRNAGFAPAELVDLLQERQAVRTLMMRRTLHLLTRSDALRLRPAHQAMVVQRTLGARGRQLGGELDLDELATAAKALFAERPRISSEVAHALADRWPGVPIDALADVVGSLVPVVQVPPRGIWGQRAAARNQAFSAWFGDHDPVPDEAEVLDDLVLRYLGAFGPATSSDVRAWSGLSGLPAVIKRLRPRLRRYRDEANRELLDLADAELTPAETPAPPRFLPAFDNVVLGYADRIRMIDDDDRPLSIGGARFVLVDGRVAASWTSTGDADSGVTVQLELFRQLRPAERTDLTAEAEALAAFLGDGTSGRVTIQEP